MNEIIQVVIIISIFILINMLIIKFVIKKDIDYACYGLFGFLMMLILENERSVK